MFTMGEIGERLRTQDNRITADPIFLVQEKKRTYGIDTDYDPQIAWLYEDESVEVEARTARLFEAMYQRTGNEPRGYRRVGYVENWDYVQPFFTEAAAELYIKQNGHNHRGELRIYADSAFRNWEWQAVRKNLMESPANPTPSYSEAANA